MLNGIMDLKLSTQQMLKQAKSVVDFHVNKPLDPSALELATALVVTCQNSLAMIDALNKIDGIPLTRSFGRNGRPMDVVDKSPIRLALLRVVQNTRRVPGIKNIDIEVEAANMSASQKVKNLDVMER